MDTGRMAKIKWPAWSQTFKWHATKHEHDIDFLTHWLYVSHIKHNEALIIATKYLLVSQKYTFNGSIYG